MSNEISFGGKIEKSESDGFFPVIDDGHVYFFADSPKLEEDKVTHYVKTHVDGTKENKFFLLSCISGLNFEFYLGESVAPNKGIYNLGFRTREYGYAINNLGEENNINIVKTVSKFLKTVVNSLNGEITEIRIYPTDSSYYKEEVDKCIKEILESSENTISEEELRLRYAPHEIFDYYVNIFGRSFLARYHDSKKSRARSRLFRMAIKKYMPEWEISEFLSFGWPTDFVITPRVKIAETSN